MDALCPPKPCGYIAYIDEAGDDGLYSAMKPDSQGGTSEWMVMSAVVVRAENETTTVKWAKDIIRDIDQHQMTHLHFSKLREDKKSIVCNAIANLPLRSFTVLSHKKNMQNHRNLAAEKARVNRTAWFFCWMSRLLLERVTAYCEYRSMNDYQELRKVRIEFSERGGVNIDEIKAYYRYLSQQSELNMLYLDLYQPVWSVVDIDQFFIYPNRMRAGLQLAESLPGNREGCIMLGRGVLRVV